MKVYEEVFNKVTDITQRFIQNEITCGIAIDEIIYATDNKELMAKINVAKNRLRTFDELTLLESVKEIIAARNIENANFEISDNVGFITIIMLDDVESVFVDICKKSKNVSFYSVETYGSSRNIAKINPTLLEIVLETVKLL